jgi:hypothetical protein
MRSSNRPTTAFHQIQLTYLTVKPWTFVNLRAQHRRSFTDRRIRRAERMMVEDGVRLDDMEKAKWMFVVVWLRPFASPIANVECIAGHCLFHRVALK